MDLEFNFYKNIEFAKDEILPELSNRIFYIYT
jgi:hypothetical protein